MIYKIFSLVVLLSMVTVSGTQAALNSYLNLTGETQAESTGTSVQQGRVMLDSDSNEVDSDEADISTPAVEPTIDPDAPTPEGIGVQTSPEANVGNEAESETSDEAHKDEIDILSSDFSDGDPDQSLITGRVYNDSSAPTPDLSADEAGDAMLTPETIGTELEDIGVRNSDGEMTDSAQVTPSQTKVIILAPSADDNSNTHDPGITILENLASIGIDDDDFGFISDGEVYVRAGFVKLGEIKGESSDSSGGKAETTWKVEKGEKAAKKPREIVVVGSKTTSQDKASPKLLEKLCSGLNATCEPHDAVTPDKLTDYAQRTVNTYYAINEIRLDDSMIEVQATQPFKLFGFIPMRLRQTVSVSTEPDSLGRIKVHFPWYHALGRKTVRSQDLQTDLEKSVTTMQISKWEAAEIDSTKNDPTSGPAGEEIMADETGQTDRPTENITFNFSEVKAQLLQTMSQVIAQYEESDWDFLQR